MDKGKCCYWYFMARFVLMFHLGTSPNTVTPKRTPSLPITLSWNEEMIAEINPLTLEKLVWPTLHDSSTRNTMSACTTVLHAEERTKERLKSAWGPTVEWKSKILFSVFHPISCHQIAVLFHHVAILLFSCSCHAAKASHKSLWIFNETQVSQRDYQYSEHSSNKTLVQRWGTLRIIR